RLDSRCRDCSSTTNAESGSSLSRTIRATGGGCRSTAGSSRPDWLPTSAFLSRPRAFAGCRFAHRKKSKSKSLRRTDMRKKYTVLHLFAGAGGGALGFKQAGFTSSGNIDFVQGACDDLEYLCDEEAHV